MFYCRPKNVSVWVIYVNWFIHCLWLKHFFKSKIESRKKNRKENRINLYCPPRVEIILDSPSQHADNTHLQKLRLTDRNTDNRHRKVVHNKTIKWKDNSAWTIVGHVSVLDWSLCWVKNADGVWNTTFLKYTFSHSASDLKSSNELKNTEYLILYFRHTRQAFDFWVR